MAPTDPPAPRPVTPSAPQAINPAHCAFISSGAAHLAAKCTFQPKAFRAPSLSRPTEPLPPAVAAGVLPDTYVVQSLTGHRPGEDGFPLFRVRWYGYEDADSTWEPAHHIDYNTVVRYCRKKRIRSPERSLWARPDSVGLKN